MIVIATNNGSTHLPRLLGSIEEYGTGGHQVLIVDTGSTSEEHLEYLGSLDTEKYTVTRTPYKGYDTGAYVWAFHNFPSDGYIFLHDSTEVLSSDWVKDFESSGADLCSYCGFPMAFPASNFDNLAQAEYLSVRGLASGSTREGIFGPIFYAKRSALVVMDKRFLLARAIPYDKEGQAGMERGWSMMADMCGLSVKHLGNLSSWRPGDTVHTFYHTLRKYSPVRS